VKTRLSPPLEPADAALLAEAMLRDVLERLGGARSFRTLLAFAPAEEAAWFAAAFPDVERRAQRGEGLGERLAELVAAELAAGAPSVVAIGSDQPLVPLERLERAHAALAGGAELVLGPDRGGGYYLIGVREPHGELFTGVTMSSEATYAETLRLARARGLDVVELEPDIDVDVEADLERLSDELARRGEEHPDHPRRTAAVLGRVRGEHRFLPHAPPRLAEPEMLARAAEFERTVATRRSVREFSPEPVPMEVIDAAIRAAGSAPSGANRQPWTFAVVTDPAVKRRIRLGAEAEERELYEHRITPEWREALAPLGVTWEKPFLETAPVLIVVFRHSYGLEDGKRSTNYYTQESVGIALGFLIAALHWAGLATLTHTPSPMGFLGEILGRPKNEKPYVLLPVGYPAEGCRVPDLARKPLDEIRVRVDP